MFGLLKSLIGFVVLLVALGFFRTWQVENSDNGKQFAKLAAPTQKLDGFYNGSVALPVRVTWLGKKFDAAKNTGINVFDNGGGQQVEQYPFATSVGQNGSSTALYIDYDQPANPFWIRPILDRVVEVGPGLYLGKLTVRVIPGYDFSLGFFRLSK